MVFTGKMLEPEGRDYNPPADYNPSILLLVSGKRKCGKDYFVDLLLKKLDSEKTAVMRIAEPIKYYWAQKHDLEFNKLMDTSAYKEQHRFEMVKWSIEVRSENNGYFPVMAMTMAEAKDKPTWICVDVRHKRDYFWFLDNYPGKVKRVRISADQAVRAERGWKFTEGVDDGPSECDLDDVTDWNLVVENNGTDKGVIDRGLDTIMEWINQSTLTL